MTEAVEAWAASSIFSLTGATVLRTALVSFSTDGVRALARFIVVSGSFVFSTSYQVTVLVFLVKPSVRPQNCFIFGIWSIATKSL